jgi:ubiquinone/menaquinone biosynthesis C-methylase UbiE
MIAVEDVDGNLLKTLQALSPLANQRVLDLGSGTGRLPLLLHDKVQSITALELQMAMLAEQAVQRARVGGRWPLLCADIRALPLPAACADLVLAGWAIGHMRAWFEADWKTHIGRAVSEMQRVAAPGGQVIIMETYSTGSLIAQPPTPGLAEYYAWLEQDFGFTRQVIQTDYQYASVEEAAQCTGFFFGPELVAAIRANGWARLPEWTGVWSKTV